MDSYGIIGHPVGHSLSPAIHNWAFTYKGLPKIYQAWDIAPENLGDFISCVRIQKIKGLSVTIPHKEAIIPLLDHVDATAKKIGAVNTVVNRNGFLSGSNTDVTGFLAPLLLQGLRPKTALVLGAGGVARAALYGLATLGSKRFLTCRNPEPGIRLAQEMNAEFIPWNERTNMHPDLIVNATPLGMRGTLGQLSPWPGALNKNTACYDLIYTPQMTPFLQQGRADGAPIISGLAMFIHQANAQFKAWTGQEFDIQGAMALAARRLHALAQTTNSPAPLSPPAP